MKKKELPALRVAKRQMARIQLHSQMLTMSRPRPCHAVFVPYPSVRSVNPLVQSSHFLFSSALSHSIPNDRAIGVFLLAPSLPRVKRLN